MQQRKGTYVYGLNAAEVAALRELAEMLGERITRGAGTGTGSMAGLMQAIAQAYIEAPWDVLHGIGGVALHRAYQLPERDGSEIS